MCAATWSPIIRDPADEAMALSCGNGVIAEQTDAIVIVVSEENGHISLVERSRIVRNLNEAQLARTIRQLLDPTHGGRRRPLGNWRSSPEPASTSAVRAPR